MKVHRDATTCGGAVNTTRVLADISVGITTSSTLGLHACCKVQEHSEKSVVLVGVEVVVKPSQKRPEIMKLYQQPLRDRLLTVRITVTCLGNVRRKDSTNKTRLKHDE